MTGDIDTAGTAGQHPAGSGSQPSEHDVALAVRELDSLVAELRALGEVGAAVLVERSIAQITASARPAVR